VKRRDFITLLGGVASAWPLAARAQGGKVFRIGMLDTVSAAQKPADFAAFKQGLRDSGGYIEGQNLTIEYRSADGQQERFPSLAADLVNLNVDLIVTRGTPAVLAAKNATSAIPIVMAAIADPLLVVASLARPGGNITGLSAFVTDLMAKRVDVLRELMPGFTRIAALLNMGNAGSPLQWSEIEKAAQAIGTQAHLLDVRKRDDLPAAFETARQHHADAVVVSIDTLTQSNEAMIVDLAMKYRLPAIYPSREFVDAGGLVTYGVNYPDLYRRAAGYVAKILKGAKPGEMPVEQPTKFELVINMKTAKALGLDVPSSFYWRADEVIE
jgi:putative ABC transport system substrate-binding protein